MQRFFTIGSLLFCLLCLTASAVTAQPLHAFETPLRSSGNLLFHMDVCQFEGDDGRTRVEVLYAIPLASQADSDSLNLEIGLRLEGKSVVYADLQEQKRFAVKRDSSYRFLDVKRFLVPDDTIAIRMSIRDDAAGRTGQIATRLVLQPFPEALSLSDLLFIASLHRPGEAEAPHFLRSGLIMVPNPERLYVPQTPASAAFFYFEVNHLQYAPGTKQTYSLRYSISDLSGQVISSQDRPGLPVQSANTSRVEKIDLEPLSPGICRLDLFVTEQSTGTSVTASRYFTVGGANGQESTLLPMTEKDQERYLMQLRFIATKEEIELFKTLDVPGKQQFLIRFWQMKDASPETAENEFMIDYFQRLAEAERRFKGGLQSDMARIYLKYGTPMDIERQFSNTRYNKPVETWTYAFNGGTSFVFVDRNNEGRYVLVHSTHPDEFSNLEWEKQLK